MKPFAAKLTLCLLFLISLVGCEKVTPQSSVVDGLTPSSTSSVLIITPTGITPLVETAVIEPSKTTTQIAATSGPLLVKTLEGTPIPPFILTEDPLESSPTPEPTVDEKDFPGASIQINNPGDFSQLASPIRVQAGLLPGNGNLVTLQLFGEDGRTMSDRLLKMVKSESGWVNLDEEIQFEISTAGESAMLVLTTHDEFGRRIAQSTSQVFLIQIGKSDIITNDFQKNPFIVQTPRANAVVKGGTVTVTGYAHAYNSNPIIIELLTESGGVMETQIVKLPRNAVNLNYVMFTAEIPYKVEIDTPVRLTIRQRSIMLPNIDVALSSQLLTLRP